MNARALLPAPHRHPAISIACALSPDTVNDTQSEIARLHLKPKLPASASGLRKKNTGEPRSPPVFLLT
jgi:hypothetical protein